MKKHIGKLVNTDQRIVVVFMRIPGDDSHSLIVSTDNLPMRMEQALMEVVESQEGQADGTLGNVLNRRLLPDTGENLLHALHNNGLLRRVHIDQVVMLPQPNYPIPLRKIIELMGGEAPKASDEFPVIQEEKFNPFTQNQQALSAEERLGIGRNLVREAEDLETVARQKREKAYGIAPELANVNPGPKNPPKAVLTETTPVEPIVRTVTKAAPKKVRAKADVKTAVSKKTV